jgi:neutral ceramidase
MRCTIGVLFCLAMVAPAQPGWKAGVARVAITPREPIWLAGFANRNRPSEGVLADIYAKALAIEDASGAVSVVFTSDLVGFTRSDVETISRRVETAAGVPRDRLLLNASHNHSAPVTRGLLPLYYDLAPPHTAAIERYSSRLLDQIVEVIAQAVRERTPVALSFEQGLAGFAVNRRRARPGGRSLPGPVDPDVPVLAVREPAGRLKAVVFGYACHATTLAGYQISGDWPGFAQAALERSHPGAVALFLAGAGADLNPLPRYHGADEALARHGVALSRMYGEILAAAVELVLAGQMAPVEGPLRTAVATVELPLEAPPDAEQLRRRLAGAEGMERREIEHLLGVLGREGRLPDRCPYPIQVWRFGETLTLIGLAGEPVVDYSLRFKALFGWERTWVTGYNNELVAYIPSRRVRLEGGYEGSEAMWEYGLPAPFTPAVEELIANQVTKLAATLAAVR